MKSYARIADGLVAELVSLPDDVLVAEAFHESLVFVEVTNASPQPEQGWTFDGHLFGPPAVPPASSGDIDAIRDRRLAAGFADPVLGKTFQTDDISQGKITAVGALAVAAIVTAASPAPTFRFIAADNSIVEMDPPTALAWSQRIADWVSATMLHARALKDEILAGSAPDVEAGWP